MSSDHSLSIHAATASEAACKSLNSVPIGIIWDFQVTLLLFQDVTVADKLCVACSKASWR